MFLLYLRPFLCSVFSCSFCNRVLFFLPNQQLKKLKNGMFDCFSWIWYNIIKEGASGMKEKE